jgi:hypothetical protein
MELNKHWTSRSVADFVYRIASDFVLQLEKRMDETGTNQKKLADLSGVSEGRLSQVFNNPGNLTLKSTVQYAQALGLKVALVAYEDSKDPHNQSGPINSEIFSICWNDAGAPHDYFDLAGMNLRIVPIQDAPRDAANTGYKKFHFDISRFADAKRYVERNRIEATN